MTQTARIGVFLAGALIIVAVGIFIVGDMGRFFHEAGYSVNATFSSVAGLDKRATVRLSGVQIGTVRAIRLEGRRPVVEMAIDPWAKIPTGSKATLSSLGLLGEKYIEILPSQEETYVPKGGMITSLAAVSFDQLGLLIVSIGDEVKGVSAQVQKFLGEENAKRFGDVLASLAETSRSIDHLVKSNQSGLDSGLRSVEHAFQGFDQNVTGMSESLTKAAQSLTDLLSENRPAIKENVDRIKAILDQINDASKKLSSILQKIDKGEGSLGQLIADPALYTEAKETIQGVNSTVRPLAGFKPWGAAEAGYYGSSTLWKGTLTFGFELGSGPFVLGQIIRDPVETTEKKFSYSLEAGRRWGPIAPRVGIIESDFGVGLDYYAFRDRFELSLDGYEFDRHPYPRLRLTSRFYPVRHFFLVFGLDEVLYGKQRELFFGLGVGTR